MMPAPDSFEASLARKFKNLAATRDLVKTLRRDAAFEILILLKEMKEVRSTDIERLVVGSGAAEASSVWGRLRDLKAQGLVEEVPPTEGAKQSVVKNRLTPAGEKLIGAFYELNKELVELPKLTAHIEGPYKIER